MSNGDPAPLPSNDRVPELPSELRRASKISSSGYWAGVFLEAADEIQRLRGMRPELPPRPPDGGGLPRYGLHHNKSGDPISVPMADGYWTPWHLADRLRAALERARQAILTVDDILAAAGYSPDSSARNLLMCGCPDAADETSRDWRPIETAPKDGQYILVKMPEWRSGPPARVTRWKDCASPGWDSIYSPAPVAWAPLPGSPQKAPETSDSRIPSGTRDGDGTWFDGRWFPDHPQYAELCGAFERLMTYTAQLDLGSNEGGPMAVVENIITGIERLRNCKPVENVVRDSDWRAEKANRE